MAGWMGGQAGWLAGRARGSVSSNHVRLPAFAQTVWEGWTKGQLRCDITIARCRWVGEVGQHRRRDDGSGCSAETRTDNRAAEKKPQPQQLPLGSKLQPTA